MKLKCRNVVRKTLADNMWRLFMICIGVVTTSFIQLRDKDFDDDDKQLSRLLKERMEGREHDSMFFHMTRDPEVVKQFEDQAEYMLKALESRGLNISDEEVGYNETRRQGNPVQGLQPLTTPPTKDEGRTQSSLMLVPQLKAPLRQKYSEFPREPEIIDIKERTMDMMQQQIYSTMYRMRDMQKIVDKYAGDLNYRMGYIFYRLETLTSEMELMYSYVNKTAIKNRVYVHLIYYNHFLKRNIDVTYITEYVIKLHTKFMESHIKMMIGNTTTESAPANISSTPAPELAPAP